MSRAEARAQLDQLWTALKKPAATANDAPGTLWDKALTPPLPLSWPPAPGMDWVQYAYAYGRDFQIADGVRVGKPWATITLHADGTATLAQLSATLEDGGVQGVTPVGQEQQAILQTGETAQATALSLTALPDPSSPPAREVKAYYASWLFYNGAIAGLVRANHAPFFAWLKEPAPASSAPTLGQPFVLAIGESATLSDAPVKITFDGVSEDSRCPKRVTCVWAGRAVLDLTAQAGESAPMTLTLATIHSPDKADRATFGGYEIVLQSVQPYPETPDHPISPAQYRATLVVTRTDQ